MLINVLAQLASDTGLHPEQQRSQLIELLNNGAKEMYLRLECNRAFREVTLVVPPDAVVSLPPYIGELRGMRMHTNELPFDLAALSTPRYVNTTLQFKFKNWRDLGDSPVFALPAVGPLTLSIPQGATIDGETEVMISGQTAQAAQVEETVVLAAEDNVTTNLFGPDIFKIACITQRSYDIIIKDYLGTEVARLYNTQQKTRYKVVDVSQIFWTLDTSDGSSFIDVCYKMPLARLTNDSDSLPVGDDYDEAWYHMCMWRYLKPMSGREQDRDNAFAAALLAMEGTKNGAEKDIVKKLSFGRNKFFGIFRKYRYFPGSVTSVDHNIQS